MFANIRTLFECARFFLEFCEFLAALSVRLLLPLSRAATRHRLDSKTKVFVFMLRLGLVAACSCLDDICIAMILRKLTFDNHHYTYI